MTTDTDRDAATTRQMQAAPHGALYVKRESVEQANADGTVTKINVFKHAGFVYAIRP